MSLLEVTGLNVRLESPGGPVVRSLSFSIAEGSVFGLAGESGCGKSVTALALMGILPGNMSARGSITFKGRELVGMSEERFRKIRGHEMAMVFQEPMTSLNPVMRVGEQIREAVITHLSVGGKDADRITLGLMRSVHIPAPEVRVNEYPHQLSGGMRQRVMVAMAISCGPSLLIADEPTTALDVTIEAQILELLSELRQEKRMSLLLITHDLGVLAENAGTVGVMYAGELVELAPVAAIFERPLHPYTKGLMNSLPRGRGIPLEPIAGTVPRPGDLPPGCAFCPRCPHAVDICRLEPPELLGLEGGDSGHLSRCHLRGRI